MVNKCVPGIIHDLCINKKLPCLQISRQLEIVSFAVSEEDGSSLASCAWFR